MPARPQAGSRFAAVAGPGGSFPRQPVTKENEYRQKIRTVRERLIADTQKQRSLAKAKEREILEGGRAEAATRLDEAMDRLKSELAGAEGEIAREAEKLAKELASSLLGRRL